MIDRRSSANCRILVLEDEPLILMDLEFAGQDRGFTMHPTMSCEEALGLLDAGTQVDVAVLDVTLGRDATCVPVAQALKARGIPFLLHSGDLDRQEERVRTLDAPLIAKPAPSEKVIAAAVALLYSGTSGITCLAAE